MHQTLHSAVSVVEAVTGGDRNYSTRGWCCIRHYTVLFEFLEVLLVGSVTTLHEVGGASNTTQC